MNPLDRRLHRSVESDPSMGTNPRTYCDWASYCQYSGSTVGEPPKALSPPSHSFYCEGSEVEDGEPLEMEEEEDSELARKHQELKKIKEQILWKKVSIALKTIDPPVTENTPPEQPTPRGDPTLKDRVTVILQQRHPAGFLSKVWSPDETLKSSSLSRHGLLQEDSQLKLRVKALMRQRCSRPRVLPTSRKVPDVTLPHPSQSSTPPAKDENSINEGFQRFLRVLNKGVDIDLLSRIVNGEGEDLPLGEELINTGTAVMENKSDPSFRSQRSNSGALLPSHDETNGGERENDPPGQDRSLIERLSLPDDGENVRGGRSYSSSSRSKSPPTAKKKKMKNEEEPVVHEQHEQLQNILNTLGLSLEAEEMSQLADRTQKRLYGGKPKGVRADSRGERDSRWGNAHRRYRNSSSSSTYSRSTSRSFSPSPSRRRQPRGIDPERRQTSECSRSIDGGGDGLTRQESKEERRCRDRTDSEETFTYQHPHPQHQTHPHPAAFSEFSDYSLSHYFRYSDQHSGTYSAASDSHWMHTESVTLPPTYLSGHPYPQNIYNHIGGSAAPPKKVFPCDSPSEDKDLFLNPDLSKSEGQSGSVSGPRYLQVVSTEHSAPQGCPRHTKRSSETAPFVSHCSMRQHKNEQEKYLQFVENQVANSRTDDKDDSIHECSEKEKQQPMEEEIKANLRKKLEAFNQRAKQKLTQPAGQLTQVSDW